MDYLNIAIVGVLAFMLATVATGGLIPLLRRAAGQNIREEGPEAHKAKAGTPSMGGLAIVIAIVITAGLAGFYQPRTLLLDAGLLVFALAGFLDDYLKVIKKQNEGLKVAPKFGIEFIGALLIALYVGYFSGLGTEVFIPFFKVYVDFGIWYVPFIVFTMLAMVNAVNFTDGLDGLAAGTTTIVALFLTLVAYRLGETAATGFCVAIVGACLGFLVFNHHPAKIFMGDTGSLALGGAITTAAIVMKMEFLLPIMGLVYVIEVLSVIIQVTYFKKTGGKRIFRMAPIHHHFELGGMKETQVVLLFWGSTLVFCLIGLFSAL